MKRKVGLVLGGGGGKGSYQVGVYKALKEYGLVKSIKGISGASIGSLNMLLFYNKDVETAEKVWMNLRRKDVLTTKSFKDYLKLSNFSLLSREGMLNIFKEHINFELIGKSKMDLYVSVSNVTENKGEYFSLKNKVDTINISVSCPTDMSGKRIKAGMKVPLTSRTNTFSTVFDIPVAEPNFNRDVVVGIARPLFLFTVK